MSKLVEELRGACGMAGSFMTDVQEVDLYKRAADEIERLVVQCHGLADAALNNGQQLLVFERALDRIVELEASEAGEPLDDAIAIAKKALEPLPPMHFDKA